MSEHVKILSGHVSPETAFVVDDYPYGFRLRCKIRYWVEFKKGHGYRVVSQTTNPKRPGEVWNKPKAGTYSPLGEVLYLDEVEHVQNAGLSYYCDAQEAQNWLDMWGTGLPEDGRTTLEAFIRLKVAYEAGKKAQSIAPPVEVKVVEEPFV